MNIQTIFGLIVTTILIALGLFFPKSKLVYRMQIIWMWILLAFNNGGGDYLVHEKIYESSSFNNLSVFNSPLYIVICAIFKKFGVEFIIINFLLNTLGLILINKIVKNNTKNKGIVLSFLLIYPLIESIIQKRFFIASCFAIYGFDLLIRKQKKYNVKSFVFIIISALLHQSCYAYVLFWILMQFDLKKINKSIIFLTGICYCCIPIIPKLLEKIFPAGKVNLYFNELKMDLIDGILWMVLHAIFVIITYLIYNYRKRNEENEKIAGEIYKLNLITLLILPLYYYEATFIRIYRGILIFNYILLANNIMKKMSKIQFTLVLIWIIYLVSVYLMVYVFTGVGFETMVVPEYTNNIFINFVL